MLCDWQNFKKCQLGKNDLIVEKVWTREPVRNKTLRKLPESDHKKDDLLLKVSP